MGSAEGAQVGGCDHSSETHTSLRPSSESELPWQVQFETTLEITSLIRQRISEAVGKQPCPSAWQGSVHCIRPVGAGGLGSQKQSRIPMHMIDQGSAPPKTRLGGSRTRKGRKPSKVLILINYCCVTNSSKWRI